MTQDDGPSQDETEVGMHEWFDRYVKRTHEEQQRAFKDMDDAMIRLEQSLAGLLAAFKEEK